MAHDMQHLIVLGDSLTLPRSWVGLGARETYASLLQKRFSPELLVSNLGIGENNTRKQVSENVAKRTFFSAQADYVVVHLGIVDCAPRLLFEPERLVLAGLQKMPLINRPANLYLRFRSRYRKQFTRRVRLAAVKLPEFESNYEKLLAMIAEQNPVRRIYLVNIAYPGAHMLERSHDPLRNIREYNDCIARVAATRPDLMSLIDVFSYTETHPEAITADDGHHLMPSGHRFIADEIGKNLNCLIRQV